MDDGHPLLPRQRPHGRPEVLIGGLGVRSSGGLNAIQLDCGMPDAAACRIGRLALGDREEPRAKVVAVAKSGISAQRGHEGLLQTVLRLHGADEADEEPMQLARMSVDEPLEWRQVHAG